MNATSATLVSESTRTSGWYRWYVLVLLMAIYAMNFIDRQIIAILAPYLKADLGLTDAQLGLLYGTAFAIFYSLFGIPLAKLADGWSRKGTLSLGLCFWSVMTTLSGFASNFAQLGSARVGVGVGEASASPAAVSLLSDYFPKRVRASIFALYTTGMYIGLGASLMIGGWIVAVWDGTFGLAGWQAAFIIVGLPGIVLGGLVHLTMREPIRGELDGHPHPGNPHPFRDVLQEAATMFAPWSILSLRRNGASPQVVRLNIAWLIAIAVVVAILTITVEWLLSPSRATPVFRVGSFNVTTNLLQWLAIGIGVYAAVSWIQSVRLRDPVAFELTVGASAYRFMALGCGVLGVYTYAIGAFVFLYGSRYLQLGPEAGLSIGAISAVAGVLGTACGGALGDVVKRTHPAGRMYLMMASMVGFSIATVIQFSTADKTMFLVMYFTALLLLTTWPPLMLATAQDLVIPRLRGMGFAVQTLCTSLIGLGVGPYMVGLISDVTGDLRFAILSLLFLMPLLLFFLWRCAQILPNSEASVINRARAAGESI